MISTLINSFNAFLEARVTLSNRITMFYQSKLKIFARTECREDLYKTFVDHNGKVPNGKKLFLHYSSEDPCCSVDWNSILLSCLARLQGQ
ncbi:hypothetical protein CEXT_622241 [Caerostris extrusa]|uniref:Uncharacterized protein n=1 Tax=Caerostris extrusa TaxID=172846 RepID=A0AAV4YDZ5_CAEEX|nr:hypothetical protein CEXT_622241 [Caerostris extrusa]